MAKKKAISTPSKPQRTEQVDAGHLTGAKASAMVSIAQSFEGPLPPPSYLKQYDEALPGAADRILLLAESQSKHRMEIEKSLISADIADVEKGRQERRLGQWLGFGICLVAIVSGATISVMGQATAGVLIGAVGLTPLVSTFISGRRAERDAKSDGQ